MKKLLITCRCWHKMEPNQLHSFMNLLIEDDSQGDVTNSSNNSLNPLNWQYYPQYPQPYPQPQNP